MPDKKTPNSTAKPKQAPSSITAFAKPVDEEGEEIKSQPKRGLGDLGEDKKDKKHTEQKTKELKIEDLKEEQKESKLTNGRDKKENGDDPPAGGEKKKSLNINLDKYLINFQRVSLRDKIFFTKNLGVMLKAGLSLGQALNALAEQTSNPKFRKILGAVKEKVNKGTSFADALKKYPKTFPELFVSMIESGEASGNMEEVLKQLHKQMKRDHELISRVRGAMIYPTIVVTAMVGIGVGMVIFVIPKFISIFEEVNAELPLPTKILINLSNFITLHGFFVALGIVIIIGSLIAYFKTENGRRTFHRLFLILPIMAPIVRKINLARFARTLSSLLKTGIPIVDAFNIAAKVLGNVHYKQALKDAAEKIKKGERVHKCLKKYKKLFPPTIIQMVTVGEESGSIETVLEEVAGFYEDDVDQTMKNLPTIIEPLLMIVLGLGVGFMAVAVLMPMYSLSQSI